MNVEILALIQEEVRRAKALHPAIWNDDPVRHAGLVCEEAGEVMKAALDYTRPGITERSQLRNDMIRELIQCAAISIIVLEHEIKLTRVQPEKDK